MAAISKAKEERMKQAFWLVERAGQNGATISEIAKGLPVAEGQQPIKVSPYLLGILEECERVGWLRKEPSTIQTGRGTRMGWRYFVKAAE